MTILRHTTSGSLYCPEAGEQSPWPAGETEDISTHPAIFRQLAEVWRNDKNGFCVLTESEFTPAELAEAVTR